MMLDAEELPDGSALDADVCIVGAGAAGIAMALELAGSGCRVLVLESGGEGPEPATQALYEGSVENPRMHSPPDRYRQRRFGGSTTIWGGRCVPFDDIDFEPRAFIPDSGWPIDADAVASFYPAANRICEAGEFAYAATEAFGVPGRPMIDGFTSPHFSTDRLERFSCPTDFGARYAHRLRADPATRIVLHANVTALQLDADGRRVRHVVVRTLSGKRHVATARRFVLAAGGLEVARLLLVSDDVAPRGIGNAHDVVGRYYMCHFAGAIGAVVFDGPPDRVFHGYELADDGTYCRRRIALEPATQREQRLGNFVARLHHPRITDPSHRSGVLSLLSLAQSFIPYEYGKRLEDDARPSLATRARHVRNVAADAKETAGFLWHWLRHRTIAERKFPSVIVRPRGNRYALDFHVEQRPDRSSRVTLGHEVDVLGMRKLHVDWRYNAGDLDTVERALALFASEIERSGVGRFEYDPQQVENEMTRYGAYGGHHIGTTRMGDDPATSVVDANCRVHGVDNLYVASAAVFPTSGQANPTLTVVALALRLAAHLKSSSDASLRFAPADATTSSREATEAA